MSLASRLVRRCAVLRPPALATLRSSTSPLTSRAPNRFHSTAPRDDVQTTGLPLPPPAPASRRAKHRGTWKGAVFRWAVAGGALYWYCASPLFSDEPAPQRILAPPQLTDADMPTVDAVIRQKREAIEARSGAAKAEQQQASSGPAPSKGTPPPEAGDGGTTPSPGSPGAGSPEALEEEAGSQGAFNPETGEINWDCPCLGGMANGPCGEQFKAAFSCFVFSEHEPKGMDCIDKFQSMQDCFREHPDVYSAELTDDEEGREQQDGLPATETRDSVTEEGKREQEGSNEDRTRTSVLAEPAEGDKHGAMTSNDAATDARHANTVAAKEKAKSSAATKAAEARATGSEGAEGKPSTKQAGTTSTARHSKPPGKSNRDGDSPDTLVSQVGGVGKK